jgi:pilus assembly protein FimV
MNFIRLPARILGEKMFVSLPRMTLMACLICPSFAWALGLGEIHLNSALNEPLSAEIDLIAAAPDELTALRATLAGRDAFTRYGIDRPPFLSSISFTVGKGKDGRDALLVKSTDAIPEPFVTFLVEVNWSRGRLMREYTVLLDPPVYTPGEASGSSAPVTAATTAAGQSAQSGSSAPRKPAATSAPTASAPPVSAPTTSAPAASSNAASSNAAGSNAARSGAGGTYSVKEGDTLTKIARSLRAETPANLDQTMIALYRANPDAFGGNINILRRGSVLRVPGGDQIAALNQNEAMNEVHRQMSTWRETGGAAPVSGHLRLVTPGTGGGTSGTGTSSSANASNPANAPGETQVLQGRVKDLESQLAESKRLLDLKNSELAALQRKLGTPATPTAPTPTAPTPTAPAPTAPAPTATAPAPTAPTPTATVPATSAAPPTPAPSVAEQAPPSAAAPESTPAPAEKPVVARPPTASGSWIDWIENNWWVAAVVIVVLLAAIAIAARKRRADGPAGALGRLEDTDVGEPRDPTAKLKALHKREDSFVVEESGPHRAPEFSSAQERTGEATSELKPSEDTMSAESAVNLDQGDPLAEADFHMAYGLYDQAADLVRIALEREPDRRDLRMKLLEIYFVWGNKDSFLQAAKTLEATRDRAPAGEWDKIVIMGRQICPDDPMFAASAGGGRGAGALVDLNLEGGENRVDIDLFGDPEGERSSLDHSIAKEGEDTAATGESPRPHTATDHLDFTLDAPERGADESPTREMPSRDDPTVESELMSFTMEPTAESPVLKPEDVGKRIASKLPSKADQTAEVSIDDLGLDLEALDSTGTGEVPQLGETTDHPTDAPTMVAGLDERSRRMMAEADSRAQAEDRDRDMTELERELEASFIADLDHLDPGHDDIKTAVLGPESAPTVMMPREEADTAATSRFQPGDFSDIHEAEKVDVDSTSKLRSISGEATVVDSENIDLDLDRLASALGSGDTLDQPRAAEEVFSTEVFESSQRNRGVDLDVGETGNGTDATSDRLQTQARTAKLKRVDAPAPELEPVTMSEVGTKLDLARAYMDMGDPEGARSILEEVVQEGSASQKQEAQRLIETLPG